MLSNLKRGLVLVLIVLAGCAGSPARDPQCRIAVWELENLGPASGPGADMGPLLTARITERLQSESPCGIVERQKLDLALSEISLGASQLSQENSRLRIGLIAGARQMVFGVYQILGSQMRMDLRLVDVSSGKVLRTAEATAPSMQMVQWLQSAEQAAGQLVDGWPR